MQLSSISLGMLVEDTYICEHAVCILLAVHEVLVPRPWLDRTESWAHMSILFKIPGCTDYILQINYSALIKETKRGRGEAGGGV